MPSEAVEQEEVKRQFEGSAKEAKPENEVYGVGGTAKDGGVSTADTVADGGADAYQEVDKDYKP